MASFGAFRSDVSKTLTQILQETKPPGGSESLTLEWVHRCLEQIPMIEKAFAKLVADIDYPMSKWGQSASDAYLKYSLNVLELLNKIKSSVSHMSQARLALSHWLTLVPNPSCLDPNHLKKIAPKDLGSDLKVEGANASDAVKCSCRKESIVCEALTIVISSGLKLFGIMISGLCGDAKPCLKARESAGKSHDPCLKTLDSALDEEIKQRQSVVKEVKEVNDAADGLVADIARQNGDAAAQLLGRKLEVLEKVLQGIGKQTDHLFSEVLAARDKFLDVIRHK